MTFRVDPDKVVAVIRTQTPTRAAHCSRAGLVSQAIAGIMYLDFFAHEVRAGRFRPFPPCRCRPVSATWRTRSSAASTTADTAPGRCYTGVIQDGMLHLIKEGIVTHASTTALALTDADSAISKPTSTSITTGSSLRTGDQQPPRGRPPSRHHRP